MQRRTFLTGVGVTVLGAATAGCTAVLGSEPITFEASPARVPDAVAEQTCYDLDALTDIVVERSFEVADRSQTVEVTNWQAQYTKAVDLADLGQKRAALFTALVTPQVEVLGRTFNPVGELSPEELADRLQDRYDNIGELEADHQDAITILGEETTQTRFSGEVQLQRGAHVDIHLHVSDPITSGDDFVIAVGGYPQQLPGEEAHVRTMMEHLEHDGS